MTNAQAAPFRVCPFCCCPISVGESSIWVHGVECHSTCFPPRPADPAWGQPSLLTEDDVRRIVREELANEQEWIPVKGLANDAADEIERLRAALVAAMEIVQEDRAAFAMANIWPDGRMDNDDGDVLRRYDAVIAQADAALGGEG